ncbi:hypothetical protein DDZ18_08475 [Marinicauda salina]|uniref:Uncharacterized protein n=1 Tax=Marinicauda salina TaxID=2135793 RepID=A0A2U2BUK1_9PROT|nr:hypothetical protein DDZ18_08475 [Marinicauda salina]
MWILRPWRPAAGRRDRRPRGSRSPRPRRRDWRASSRRPPRWRRWRRRAGRRKRRVRRRMGGGRWGRRRTRQVFPRRVSTRRGWSMPEHSRSGPPPLRTGRRRLGSLAGRMRRLRS